MSYPLQYYYLCSTEYPSADFHVPFLKELHLSWHFLVSYYGITIAVLFTKEFYIVIK